MHMSFTSRLGWIALAMLTAGAPIGAAADDSREPGRRVRFSVQSARDVPNDWLRAVVGVTEEDTDSAAVADRVNRAMAWALEEARKEKSVQARSSGYHTQPVVHDGKVRRWRASQDLVLEGSDSDAMTALLGKLQSRVQLRSFTFSVSDKQRRAVEDSLVEEALAGFRARADLVRRSLEARGYSIDEISIDTGRGGGPVPRMAMAMEASSSVAPPAVQAGTSKVSVSVHGTIALE
jgi:predicted secreted protein